MPKKAIVASSSGKGLRLALPGPIKQSQSTQESGSSTQQLQSAQKSASSTQQSPSQSSQQAKQTKANYAFPIQTLMALQDQGVTKINKKSWAEICSESDEEIDLTQLIAQAAKQKTIIPSPQEKAILSKPQNTSIIIKPQKAQTNYIPTNKFSNIIQMEPEFWDKSPIKVIQKIFPTGFHFKPISPRKTRQFYEFILEDTDSFYQWWDFFGPIPEISPSPTNEGFKIFQSKFDKQETCVPVMLKFFSIFSLLWVFSWQYNYGKPDHSKAFPILQRHAYVKWWFQFDSSMAYPEKVREWFKNNPESQKISDPETASFLNQKAQIQAVLLGSQSKQSIKGKLKQILHLLQEDEEPLQHSHAVPTVIIDGFMDTAPTDGLAVANNITTVGTILQIIHVYDAWFTDA
ncbi:hypothetical protein PIB30_103068 [Stylosanthes scabra]|uniref:Uncharacterized protein n=1 Tax=Stylosanthes scabra TaxID=79078 RepID=A0ABU6VY31_9FABA|nr:hypothetical protein [Stylosanthes scabra]